MVNSCFKSNDETTWQRHIPTLRLFGMSLIGCTRSCVHDYLDHVVTRGHTWSAFFKKKYTIINFSVTIFCVTYVLEQCRSWTSLCWLHQSSKAYGAWMSDRWAVSCDPVKYLVVVGRHCKVRFLTKIHLSTFTKFREHSKNMSTPSYIKSQTV